MQDFDSSTGKATKGVREVLIAAHKELSEMQRENIDSHMKFRRELFLATIAVITAVTPFADTYVHYPILYWSAYSLLFLSSIVGLFAEELMFHVGNWLTSHGQKHLSKSIEMLFGGTSDEKITEAMKEFKKMKQIPRIPRWLDLSARSVSTLAFLSFILGMILLALSLIPLNFFE